MDRSVNFCLAGGEVPFSSFTSFGPLNSSYDKYFENDLTVFRFADKKMFG
jgi:hypothetical protein